MKTNFTKEFYEEHFDRFIKESKMNLEEDLTFNLKFLEGLEIPEDVIEKIRNSYAKEIAEKAEKELKERMKIVKGLENGSVSLGYTTQIQETRETSRYIRIFEFDCYQLSKFRKDHNIIG